MLTVHKVKNHTKNKNKNKPKTKINVKVSTRTHRKSNRQKRLPLSVLSFLRASVDPFNNTPPPLGFGTFMPTNVITAWNRTFQPVPNTVDNFSLFVMDPSAARILKQYSSVASTTAWNVAPVSTYDAANLATITTIAQSARTIAGGLRIRTANAATSPVPSFYAGLVYSSTAAIAALTPESTIDLPTLSPIFSVDNSAEVLYRIGDTYDLEFNANAINGWGGNLKPMCVIMIVGGSLTDCISYIDAVIHLEVASGTLAGLQMVTQTSLAMELPNLESLSPYLARLGPVARVATGLPGAIGVIPRSLSTNMPNTRTSPVIEEVKEDADYETVRENSNGNNSLTNLGIGTALASGALALGVTAGSRLLETEIMRVARRHR